MTQKRRDDKSTEFGLWLREQKEIDSSNGFVVTNIDYIYRNRSNGKYMILEEKRYCHYPKSYQFKIYKILDDNCKNDPLYYGFHLIIFEKTSPDDGKIFFDPQDRNKLNDYLISNEKFLDFLQFRLEKDIYLSRFDKRKIWRKNNHIFE